MCLGQVSHCVEHAITWRSDTCNEDHGDTSDISFLAEFGFYDWVWFLPKTGEKKRLGKFLIPSINVGPAMCGVVLTEKGTTRERTSIWPMSDEDLRNPEVLRAMEAFTVELNKKLKMHDAGLKAEKSAAQLNEELENTPYSVKYEPFTMAELEDEFDPQPITLPPADKLTEKEQVDLDQNRFISARVKVPVGGEEKFGKVLGRKRDADGELIRKSSSDPLQDTAVYDVEFDDGAVEQFTANIIAESIYSKLNPDGSTTALLEEITDHKRDDTALTMASGFDPGPNGTRVPKKTTKGWHLLARFKNGAEQWISLKAFKDASPVEVAEYALRNQLIEEPAFKWWAPHVLKKRKRILSAMKRRYFRTHTKFGIELPKTVERALEIDKETGTTLWADAIAKEMKTVFVAFEILPEDKMAPPGHKFIKCHLIYDVKNDGSMMRKARFVAGGHMTGEPECMTYASVVSRESIRLAFMLASLNNLDVLQCDDVWMRKGFNKASEKVWEYVLIYSDDLLIVARNPGEIAAQVNQHFKLKEGSIKEPTSYLGADIGKFTLPDKSEAWFMGSENYVKEAIKNVESWMKKRAPKGSKWVGLKTKVSGCFPSNWVPETDTSPLLNDEDAHWFQQQVGVLRWMCELGRVEISAEVSMLAAFSCAPRQGHLDAVLHLFAWLKMHKRSKLVFDPSPMERPAASEAHGWEPFYSSAKEKIPHDMPEPRGKEVQMTAWVDSDHAGNVVTRRSRTGVLIFCNRSPIVFHSKTQGSIETSSFGSEFIAMKTGIELIAGL